MVKVYGFSGKPVQQHPKKDQFPSYPSNAYGPCEKHGWACRAFEDHATRP